jgi:hypothetical protein
MGEAAGSGVVDGMADDPKPPAKPKGQNKGEMYEVLNAKGEKVKLKWAEYRMWMRINKLPPVTYEQVVEWQRGQRRGQPMKGDREL